MAILLSLILVLATFFRSFGINTVPPELFGDELDVGYQAYSLFKTGRDLYSQPLPFYLKSLSEPRLPLLIYATVPGVAILGLTPLSTRLPEIIFGSLAPVIIFFFTRQLTGSKKIALWSALALTFMPVAVHYSRSAYEVALLLDLVMLGTLLWLKRRFLLSLLFFALGLYTYSTATVFVPLLLIWLIVTTKPKKVYSYSVIFFILISPYIYYLFTGTATNRFSQINIFKTNDVIDFVFNLKNETNFKYERYFTNSYVYTAKKILGNYLSAFTPEFLFLTGDPNLRQSMQTSGLLFPALIPFLAIGLFTAARKRWWLLFFWLLISPLPASVTADGARHATRMFYLTAPLAVLVGIGASALIRKKYLFYPLLILSLLNFVHVGEYYLVHYPKISWRFWHYGYRQAFTELQKLAPDYSRVYINNTYEPALIRFLFYFRYPPAEFHQEFTVDQPVNNLVPFYNGFSLGSKYVFGSFDGTINKNNLGSYLQPQALYFISQQNEVPAGEDWRTNKPAGIKVLSTITNPYDAPLFYLVTKSD